MRSHPHGQRMYVFPFRPTNGGVPPVCPTTAAHQSSSAGASVIPPMIHPPPARPAPGENPHSGQRTRPQPPTPTPETPNTPALGPPRSDDPPPCAVPAQAPQAARNRPITNTPNSRKNDSQMTSKCRPKCCPNDPQHGYHMDSQMTPHDHPDVPQ